MLKFQFNPTWTSHPPSIPPYLGPSLSNWVLDFLTGRLQSVKIHDIFSSITLSLSSSLPSCLRQTICSAENESTLALTTSWDTLTETFLHFLWKAVARTVILFIFVALHVFLHAALFWHFECKHPFSSACGVCRINQSVSRSRWCGRAQR